MATTTEQRVNTYEGMFLFPHSATGNLQAAVDHLTDVLGRAEAEIISIQKWDERRLAYDIAGNKRGVYFLVYFRAPSANLAGLERHCNLSEQLLRAMITRADHLTAEQIQGADRRSELEDEIRLRSEEGETTDTGRSVVVARRSSEAAEAPTDEGEDRGDEGES